MNDDVLANTSDKDVLELHAFPILYYEFIADILKMRIDAYSLDRLVHLHAYLVHNH